MELTYASHASNLRRRVGYSGSATRFHRVTVHSTACHIALSFLHHMSRTALLVAPIAFILSVVALPRAIQCLRKLCTASPSALHPVSDFDFFHNPVKGTSSLEASSLESAVISAFQHCATRQRVVVDTLYVHAGESIGPPDVPCSKPELPTSTSDSDTGQPQ